jgi:hypothetical protein
LAACSSDSSSPDTTGGSGGKGGTSASTGGKGGTGGTGTAGKGGASAGGTSAGGTTAGGASSGGTSAGGTTAGGTGGSTIGAAGMGGEPGAAGDTSEGGAAGAPTTVPAIADEAYFAHYCFAIDTEDTGCSVAPAFSDCFETFKGYLDTTTLCAVDNDTLDKYLALVATFNDLATACPTPDKTEVTCDFVSNVPKFSNQKCRDADAAMQASKAACEAQ